MIRFRNIAYVALVLSILLISAPIANAYYTSEPVTYRAELTPFHEGLTWKQRIPAEGGPISVDLEATVNPGTITAEVSGDIRFDRRSGIISVLGTSGKLSSDGDAVLKGNVFIDFVVPLSEAFFGENEDYHVTQAIELPGLNISKGWNKSGTFDTSGTRHPLLLGYDESFTLYIPEIELAVTGLGAAEILPMIARGAPETSTAVEIFVDNISDYLEVHVGLYASLSSQPTLSGKLVTVKGTLVNYAGSPGYFGETKEIKVEGRSINTGETKEIKMEGIPILGPNFRRPRYSERKKFNIDKVAYKIESSYDAELTYTLGVNVQVRAHANASICGGIEIWSYTRPPAPAIRFPLLSEQTFDLDFSDAEPVLIHIVPVGEDADQEQAKGVIPDPDLAKAIRKTLGLDSNDPPLSVDDMLSLKKLIAGANVSLKGLEYAVNLRELDLWYNEISDVSPLSGLTNLRTLDLVGNSTSELSLSGFTNLTNLTLGATRVNPSKVSLSDMPNLTKLDIQHGMFSELSLSNLPKLEASDWWSHFSTNMTGFKLSVSDMPQLTTLGLTEVNISELSLSDMPKLIKLTFHNTNISALSLSDMPQLTELSLPRSNNISEVSLSGMPQLTKLYLQYSNIPKLSLPYLPQLTELSLLNSNLSELRLSDMPQLTTLNLRATNLSALSLPDVPQLTKLYLLRNNNLSALWLPDSMPQLTELHIAGSNLSELSLSDSKVSLPNVPKLTKLTLQANKFSELLLPPMWKLTELHIADSNLSELRLPAVPKLTKLTLAVNSISNIPALSVLTRLTELNLRLRDNDTLALSLSGLTQLTKLVLGDNSVSELSLSGMPELTELNLEPNHSISEVSLSGLIQLTTLNLRDTNLSALSLSDMPQLTTLYLSRTHISDISQLLELPNLQELQLHNTPLNYVSRNTHIPALRKKGVRVEFDGRSPHLEKISGEDQRDAPNTELPLPFVVQAFDWIDEPIPDMPIRFVIYQGEGTLSTTITTTDATGKAETRLTLGSVPGEIKVGVIADFLNLKTSVSFTATANYADEDVNRDGTVDIDDFLQVRLNLGKTGETPNDVNGDGIVNIQDLVAVAKAFGEEAAAPSAHATIVEHLTATEVAQWLQEAQQANLTDPDFQRGVDMLKHLLSLLVPKETALLANYPNPFNPETWIPYQLSAPGDVTIEIHAIDGTLIRTVSLGHQPVGIYKSRTRAAYWDGRNELGEPVASGVYFYTLTAGDFSATRKMLIRK